MSRPRTAKHEGRPVSADLALAALWPLLALCSLVWIVLLTFLATADQLPRGHMWSVFKVLWKVTGLVVGMVGLMLGVFSCESPLGPPAPAPRDAVVTLECWHEQEQIPCCNAFTVRRLRGLRLETAAHCLHGLAQHERAKYAMRNGPPWNEAEVESIDEAHDRAELRPLDTQGLGELQIGAAPIEGQLVRVVSAYAGWAELIGVVVARGGDNYATTLDVRPGWSGSPVIDWHGRAVGIATRCVGGDLTEKWCQPNTGRFIGLEQ